LPSNSIFMEILELLKYTVPALVVLVACYMIVNKFLVSQIQRKQLALFHESQDITLRLRLQAYERLALFVERINPRQLIPRLYESGMTVNDLQYTIMFAVRTEFEHNLSQQIYVSKHVWETVKNVKEQELNMVVNIGKELQPDAPAKELHMRITDFVMTMDDELPTDVALQIINEEAKRILFYGNQGS
jgi:hypothetical protein